MSTTFTDIATIEIARIFAPLKRLDNPQSITAFVNELGWRFDEGQQIDVDLGGLISSVADLLETVLAIVGAEDDDERIELAHQALEQTKELIMAVDEIIPQLETAIQNIPDFFGEAENMAPTLTRRFFDYLLYMYLQRFHRQIFALLHIIGFAEIVDDSENQPIKTIQWTRLSLLFTDPKEILNKVYHWDDNQPFDGDEFLTRVEVLLKAFNLPGGLYTQNEDLRTYFGRADDDDKELRIPLYQGGIWQNSNSPYTELALNVFPIPSSNGDKAGLALYPYMLGELDLSVDINESWKFTLKGNVDLDSGFGLQIRPPAKLHMDTSIFESPQDFINARLELGILSKAPPETLNYVFGSEDGSFLGYGEIGFNFITALDDGKEEIAGEMVINDLTLKIDLSEGDGFLQQILAGVKIETVTDLVIGVSNLDGFYFRGSGALEIEIPIHKSLGPIKLHTLYIRFTIGDDMELQFAASLGFELGPITGSVEKIGIGIPFAIKGDNEGNLGPIDVKRPVFVPPLGAGMAMDAGGIIGGGYLEFDDENKRYAGILSLKFGEIGLVAIGLITTRMPDGSDGFSLLVNIGVTFSPPIQLSMGFTLNAVGGLVGINRTMDIEVLQAGIKTRTLDSILFPDPDTVIENAPKIISDLRAVFPPQVDRFVIGPMIQIGWGSPSIITADIGIFIEIPEPIRIVLMGQVEATLPEKEAAIVEIHLDILGVLDLEKEVLTFQASLYDSTLLTFEMYGDSAMLVGWGNDPRFAMSMGGFHPKFTPPPPPIIFAELRRLSITISKSDSLRFSCTAYQAITPNTLQFGARVDCYASFAGVTATGYLYFDALFYFSPFSFTAAMGGGISIKYQGYNLADIHLNCTLSGPNPWKAKGKVKFKVLCFNIKEKFSITWGDPGKKKLASIDPWKDLQDTISISGNWSSKLPSSSSIVATLRPMEEDGTTIPVVHPSGKLEFRQNVVPLDLLLDKVSNAPIKGHNKFSIEKVTMTNSDGGEEDLETTDLKEQFSRAQYQKFSNKEKLALPSFEKIAAGVQTEDDNFEIFGSVEETELQYETILIEPDRTSKRLSPFFYGGMFLEEMEYMQTALEGKRMRESAVVNPFLHPENEPMISVPGEELYHIASADDLGIPIDDGPESGLPRVEIDEILNEQEMINSELVNEMNVVTDYEFDAMNHELHP